MKVQLWKQFKPRISVKFYSEKFNETIFNDLNLSESIEDAPETPLESKQRLSERFTVGHNHLGASIVPDTLQTALNRILKGYPRRQLRQDVSKLAESYAKMTKVSAESLLESNFEKSSIWSEADRQALVEFSSPAVEYGPKETFAYIASQLPFMLAPLENVFAEIVRRIPGFAPKSMLDFGSGPGTAIIAAQKHWSSSLNEIMAVDVSQSMLEISAEIIKEYPNLVDRVELRRYISMNPNRPKYNLVVSSMVLSELADDHLRQQSVDHLWQQTDNILVLIDRGNAEGFRILRNARDWLIKNAETSNSKLHIVAPCSHELKCPMSGSWCHFTQRMQLNHFQNELFNLPRGFEDQKFSYLVVRRGERPKIDGTPETDSFHWPRIARPPLKRNGHVIHDVCSTQGQLERFVSAKSHGKQEYHDARKSYWGDLWPHAVKTAVKVVESFKRKIKQEAKSTGVNYSYDKKSPLTLQCYSSNGVLINSDPEYYRTPVGELESLILGKKAAIKKYFGEKLILNQEDTFEYIFYALVAPSMTGKTQTAFTFKILRSLYFLFDANVILKEQGNIQEIYKNFTQLSKIFLECVHDDFAMIIEKVRARAKNFNIYDHISAQSLEENCIGIKFKSLGFVHALITHANSNFDPSKSTWMEFFASSSRNLNVKAMNLAEFRACDDHGDYILFLDEFDSSDEGAFVRNLFRAAFIPVLVASTNAKAANLVGKVSSGFGRPGNDFSWSIVAIKLNSINQHVLNGMIPNIFHQIAAIAVQVHDTRERNLIIGFLKNFFEEQLVHLRPGFAQFIIRKLFETFGLNLPNFTLNNLLQIIVDALAVEMRSKKPQINGELEGIMGSFALFMSNAFIPADISPEDFEAKLLHMKSYLQYHFHYLINPVDNTKWCFIANRPMQSRNIPSLRPLTIYNNNWPSKTKEWSVEYTYFKPEEIIPFLSIHSIPKTISISSAFKSGIRQAETDPKATGDTSNSSQTRSLSGNLLEVISSVCLIEASQHCVGSAGSTSTFYGQDGKSFLTNLIENLIESPGFRGQNKIELKYDRIKNELDSVHVPYLFPEGMKLPNFFKQNYKNCEGFKNRSVNFGEFYRTRDSSQIDAIFNFFVKNVDGVVPFHGICAVECKNWRKNLLVKDLGLILQKAIKNDGDISLIICNSLGISKPENLLPFIEYCKKTGCLVLKLRETQISKEFELVHYCHDMPSTFGRICIIIEFDIIDPKPNGI